jgi:hypothetical protein
MELKIDTLSRLLPDKIITHKFGYIHISPSSYNRFSESTTIEEMTDHVNIYDCYDLLRKCMSEHEILSKYYSIVNFINFKHIK